MPGSDPDRRLVQCGRSGRQARRRAREDDCGADGRRDTVVLEGQGWVCGICARPIPRDVDPHDDLALTIDHVIPIALGGQHTLPNLQPAHRACNVAKGDTTPAWWSRAAA